MKKLSVLMLMAVMMICSSCGKKEEESKKTPKPEIAQVKSICELATMDCYYHNVAKYYEEDADGILLWKKDKHFWIEYEGVVTLGIEASLVTIEVDYENVVTITMPMAEVLNCKVDETTFSEDSFIIADDSADITAEDQTQAFKIAQYNMRTTAENDTALLASAQERAQKLLTDYVNNMGDAFGVEYDIKWVYLDEWGNPL